MLRVVSIVLALTGPVGCAQGVAEFGAYTAAFSAQREAADQVLDRVGRAERILFNRASAGMLGDFPDFEPADAAYFVAFGDPPVTGSLRASIGVLERYNIALMALAEGRDARAYLAQAAGLSAEMGATGMALAAAQPRAAALVGGVVAGFDAGSAALAAAQQLIDAALTAASRAEFRDRLIAAAPEMRDLIDALRVAATPMFAVMRRAAERTRTLAEGGGDVIDDPEALKRDRALIAGWVLLLEQTRAALDAAAAAAQAPAAPAGGASLAEATATLRALAQTIKAMP